MSDNYRLSDELLTTIANGSGRVYPYEGRAMAAELIEHRRIAADAAKAKQVSAQTTTPTGLPYP